MGVVGGTRDKQMRGVIIGLIYDNSTEGDHF